MSSAAPAAVLDHTQEWRPALVSRVALIVAGLGSISMGTAMAMATLDPCRTTGCLTGGAVVLVLAALAAAAVAAVGVVLLSGAFMSLTLTTGNVVVRNLLWRRRTLPLARVVDAGAGRSGVVLTLDDDTRVTCWAVQTPSVRLPLRGRGRSETAARQIRRAAGAGRTAASPGAPSPSVSGDDGQ